MPDAVNFLTPFLQMVFHLV